MENTFHKKTYLGLLCLGILFCICVGVLFHSRNRNAEGKAPKKVGAIYMTMNNPYFEVVNEEIKAIVKERGDILLVRDSAMDNEIQNQQIEDLIEEGADILIINAVDWKGVSAGLKKAKEAGVPVIAVDAEVYDDSLVACTVISDNDMAGALCAENLMKERKEANILFLIQSANKSALDRIQGFKDALDAAGWSYHVVDELDCQGQLEVTQPLVEELLSRTKEIDVVMALNDPSALGAMAALDAEGMLEDVLVYGTDGAPEAKRMIKEGRMQETIAQSPMEVGKVTARMIYDVLDGKEVPKMTEIPVWEITSSNVDEFDLTGWQ